MATIYKKLDYTEAHCLGDAFDFHHISKNNIWLNPFFSIVSIGFSNI
jgi:hypothetical protein